jgi:hypothetical protein
MEFKKYTSKVADEFADAMSILKDLEEAAAHFRAAGDLTEAENNSNEKVT